MAGGNKTLCSEPMCTFIPSNWIVCLRVAGCTFDLVTARDGFGSKIDASP